MVPFHNKKSHYYKYFIRLRSVLGQHTILVPIALFAPLSRRGLGTKKTILVPRPRGLRETKRAMGTRMSAHWFLACVASVSGSKEYHSAKNGVSNPLPPLSFFFLVLAPYSAQTKHRKSRSSVFLCFQTPRKRLLRRLTGFVLFFCKFMVDLAGSLFVWSGDDTASCFVASHATSIYMRKKMG